MDKKKYLYVIIFLATLIILTFYVQHILMEKNANIDFSYQILIICMTYTFSHILRMFRLLIISLNERKKAPYLMLVHGVTSFPSAFIPFKLGELFRILGFISVFNDKNKAFAIWLVERFSDIVVISIIILMLYLFKIPSSENTEIFLLFFLIISLFCVLTYLAISKAFIYLNSYLVLSSHSSRSLAILKISNIFKNLEEGISSAIEGRFYTIIFTTILIWLCEIVSICLFVSLTSHNLSTSYLSAFSNGLVDVLSNNNHGTTYTNLILIVTSLISIASIVFWVIIRVRRRNG